MQLTILSLIYFIAFSHALLMSIALLKRAGPFDSGRNIAYLLLVMAYKLLEGGITYSSLYLILPHALDWLPGSALLIGPLFYGYIRSLSRNKLFHYKQWLLHLSPAILLTALNIPQLLIPASQKIQYVSQYLSFEGSSQLSTLSIIFLMIIKLHLTVYLVYSWKLITKYSVMVAQFRADDSVNILNKQKMLCLALIVLEAVWVLLFLLEQFSGFIALDYVSQVWLLFMACIILTMGYFCMKQPQFFFNDFEATLINENQVPLKHLDNHSEQNVVELDKNTLQKGSSSENLKNNQFDANTAQSIADAIDRSLRIDRLYLDEKLSLSTLAKHLELKPHWVSQILNQHMKSSFYKLVNHFRIQQVIRLLGENYNWSLERIAYESGFGNRVTFTNAFKEIKGCTPSAYRKKLKVISCQNYEGVAGIDE